MGFYGQLVLEYGPRLAALLLLLVMLGTMGSGCPAMTTGIIAREEAILRLQPFTNSRNGKTGGFDVPARGAHWLSRVPCRQIIPHPQRPLKISVRREERDP